MDLLIPIPVPKLIGPRSPPHCKAHRTDHRVASVTCSRGSSQATASGLRAESVLVSATTPSFQMPLERLGGFLLHGVWRLEGVLEGDVDLAVDPDRSEVGQQVLTISHLIDPHLQVP